MSAFKALTFAAARASSGSHHPNPHRYNNGPSGIGVCGVGSFSYYMGVGNKDSGPGSASTPPPNPPRGPSCAALGATTDIVRVASASATAVSGFYIRNSTLGFCYGYPVYQSASYLTDSGQLYLYSIGWAWVIAVVYVGPGMQQAFPANGSCVAPMEGWTNKGYATMYAATGGWDLDAQPWSYEDDTFPTGWGRDPSVQVSCAVASPPVRRRRACLHTFCCCPAARMQSCCG